MASNNHSVNVISDEEELAQKRQDLLNKNKIKSENNAKKKAWGVFEGLPHWKLWRMDHF